uniref:Uncharacterized protein n=1 Tax=Arion vulgaris TaxID=1028688 RepID=A0A0B7BKZ2_9EUPU
MVYISCYPKRQGRHRLREISILSPITATTLHTTKQILMTTNKEIYRNRWDMGRCLQTWPTLIPMTTSTTLQEEIRAPFLDSELKLIT